MNLKEKIIHESLRLFSLKGFLSTSLQDILEAAHTSKGGFYNHFGSKEDLFLAVLRKAQRIWREKNLTDLHKIDGPINKIKKLLENYREKYIKDAENFPGGCIFVTLSVELDDQRPHLSQEINKGFAGFRGMLKGLLDQGKESGELDQDEDTAALAEMIFSGMLGASVLYGTQKSVSTLDQSLNSLIDYLDRLGSGKNQ
jgi:TetR/AcrR family transcriptional repressor of nem operon